VPAAWAAVGFCMPCHYINIANNSTQYSPQDTPIQTCSGMLLFPVYNVPVDGTCNIAVQL